MFSGNLKDLPITDVLQLLHISRKSGTLCLEGPGGEVRIVLKDGGVIGANHPSDKINIGRILVEKGQVSEQDITAALRRQEMAGPDRKPLLATLIEMDRIDQKQGWEGLEKLIEEALVEVVSWRRGNFSFEVDNIEVFDEFRHFPDDGANRVPLDTQRLLMDAIRILDERNRVADQASSHEAQIEESEAPAGDSLSTPTGDEPPLANILSAVTPVAAEDLLAAMLTDKEQGAGTRRNSSDRKAVLFCQDGLVKNSLHTICKEQRIDAFISEFDSEISRRLDHWTRDGKQAILVVDLPATPNDARWLGKGKRLLQQTRRVHPEVPMVLLGDNSWETQQAAYALGAKTVLPRPTRNGQQVEYVEEMKSFFPVLTQCLNSIFDQRDDMAREVVRCKQQMAVLRQRLNEIQWRGEESPEISLVVLRYVADFLDRCIIFLVRPDDLRGLGAFGVDESGETLTSAVVKLEISLATDSIFKQVVDGGMVFHGECDDSILKDHLYPSIGLPESPEIVLLPLQTETNTVALIYGDFGSRPAAPIQTDALEIIASQAGMAFQIALLKRNEAGKKLHS